MAKKKTARKRSKVTSTKPLDENTSALVVAELLVMGYERTPVKESEIAAILDGPRRGLSIREIALTSRISQVLDLPDPFVMAPRFQGVFANLCTVLKADAKQQTRAD
jgi:hypothetical protein